MKRNLLMIIIFSLALILVGCGDTTSSDEAISTPPVVEKEEPKIDSEFVDDVTQGDSIDAYVSSEFTEYCTSYSADVIGCTLLTSKDNGFSTTQMLENLFEVLGIEYDANLVLQDELLEAKEIYDSANSEKLILDLVKKDDDLWTLTDVADVPSMHAEVKRLESSRNPTVVVTSN